MNRTMAIGVGAVLFLSFIGIGVYAYNQHSGIAGGKVETSSSFLTNSYNVSYAAERADIIVQGTVTEVGEPQWPTEDGTKPLTVSEEDLKGIYTPVTIRINETLKGTAHSEITLRVSTGTIDGYKRVSARSPSYTEGESVLIFIQEWEGYYRTLWKDLGKFNIDQDVIERDNAPAKYQQQINVSELQYTLRQRYSSPE